MLRRSPTVANGPFPTDSGRSRQRNYNIFDDLGRTSKYDKHVKCCNSSPVASNLLIFVNCFYSVKLSDLDIHKINGYVAANGYAATNGYVAANGYAYVYTYI